MSYAANVGVRQPLEAGFGGDGGVFCPQELQQIHMRAPLCAFALCRRPR